jgi:high affinity Mn2+ porin
MRRARGENLELTLAPWHSGTIVRMLAYRNIARMGDYVEALAQAAASGARPNISPDDRDGRRKYGVTVSAEQPLADVGECGAFLRLGWNDGATESFAFTEVDRHLSLGGQLSGVHWGRTDDRVGAASAR